MDDFDKIKEAHTMFDKFKFGPTFIELDVDARAQLFFANFRCCKGTKYDV